MKRLIILFLLLSGISGPLVAQDLQRIVAVVNDEVISLRDITERSRIIIATARLPDNADVRRAVREQALRSLIDERLQMQEAKRRGISITQGEVDAAVAQIERQMNIPPGRFEEFTTRAGIDPNMIINQVRSELTWTRMVRSRLMSSTTTTDQEIDEAIAKLRSAAGQTEELLSEILIPVDSPDQEEVQRQNALQILQQARAGASFPALARQFSRGTTAANGGDVGWVQRGTLAEEVERAVAGLQPGQISEPIRTVGGYLLVALRDRRRIAMPGSEDSRVTLKQILLPLPQNARNEDVQAAVATATQAQAQIGSCDDVETVAAKFNAPGSGSLGTLRMGDLPPAFRQAISGLAVNQTSAPVPTPRAVHLFTVCDLEQATAFDRDQIRQTIMLRKAEQLAQRYIRELRRDATIEFR